MAETSWGSLLVDLPTFLCSHDGYYYLEKEKADFRGGEFDPHREWGKTLSSIKQIQAKEFFLLLSIKPMCYYIRCFTVCFIC